LNIRFPPNYQAPGLRGVIKCLITMLAGAPRAASVKRDHAIT
jgi:hypothetical protein